MKCNKSKSLFLIIVLFLLVLLLSCSENTNEVVLGDLAVTSIELYEGETNNYNSNEYSKLKDDKQKVINENIVFTASYIELPQMNDIYLSQAWKINFNKEFEVSDIGAVVIEHNNTFIPVEILMNQNQKYIIVSPYNRYERNTIYTIRIFLHNGNQYRMNFLTEDISFLNIEFNKNQVIEIQADPDLGFHWNYYLFLPQNILNNQDSHLMVLPINTGTSSDDVSFVNNYAKNFVSNNYLGTSLNKAVLMPAIPRPRTQPEGVRPGGYAYTHALCRQTMKVTQENFKRVDLQLLAMVDHAIEMLDYNGLKLRDKIFIDGFSASGNYITRFVLLHPERIRAATAGGLNGMPTLPVSEYDGMDLRYPVGISDIEELTGKPFNEEAFKEISIYYYMGYLDENDTLPFTDAYDPEDQQTLRELLGEHMIYDRWPKSIEIFESINSQVQFNVYNDTAHEIKSEMWQDIIKFFQKNRGEEIVHINPHEYDYVEPGYVIKEGIITHTKNNDAEGIWKQKHHGVVGFHIYLNFIESIKGNQIERIIYNYSRPGRTSGNVQFAKMNEVNDGVYKDVFLFTIIKTNSFQAAILPDNSNTRDIVEDGFNVSWEEFHNFVLNVINESDDVIFGDID